MIRGFSRAIWLTPVFLAVGMIISCGSDNGVGSVSWSCNVTLRLDSLTGEGSGSGGSRDEALTAALRTACSALNLDSEQRSRCERNQSFSTVQTLGNITIVTPGEKSIRCSGSS